MNSKESFHLKIPGLEVLLDLLNRLLLDFGLENFLSDLTEFNSPKDVVLEGGDVRLRLNAANDAVEGLLVLMNVLQLPISAFDVINDFLHLVVKLVVVCEIELNVDVAGNSSSSDETSVGFGTWHEVVGGVDFEKHIQLFIHLGEDSLPDFLTSIAEVIETVLVDFDLLLVVLNLLLACLSGGIDLFDFFFSLLGSINKASMLGFPVLVVLSTHS